MTQKQDTYKQTKFGEFSIKELIDFIEADTAGREWLDAFSKNVAFQFSQRGDKAKQFGQESAKELIAAAIIHGVYVPIFARGETK